MPGFRFRWFAGLSLALFTLIAFVGCGGSTARISGKVLLNGEPVPSADIEFVPKEDDSQNFRGVLLEDGSYAIDYGPAGAMPIGDYLVKVTLYRTRNGKPLPEGEEGEVLKSSGKVQVLRYVLELPVTGSSSSADLLLEKGTLQPDEQ